MTINATLNADKIYDIDAALVNWALGIDFEPIKEALEAKLGFAINFDTIEVSQPRRRGVLAIRITTQEIINECGAMAAVMDSVKIETFNTSVRRRYAGVDAGVDVDDNIFWATLYYCFELKTGGSNGCEFATIRYTDKDGWEIRFVGK
jgi:hypothetical protein